MAKHTRNSSRSDNVAVEVKSKVSGGLCLGQVCRAMSSPSVGRLTSTRVVVHQWQCTLGGGVGGWSFQTIAFPSFLTFFRNLIMYGALNLMGNTSPFRMISLEHVDEPLNVSKFEHFGNPPSCYFYVSHGLMKAGFDIDIYGSACMVVVFNEVHLKIYCYLAQLTNIIWDCFLIVRLC